MTDWYANVAYSLLHDPAPTEKQLAAALREAAARAIEEVADEREAADGHAAGADLMRARAAEIREGGE